MRSPASEVPTEKPYAPLFDGLGDLHHTVMEAAYWPIPTRPTLGAALLQNGDATKAEQVFREDLKRWPRNGWALFGLEHSLRRQGKTQLAELVRQQFDEAWKRADVRLDLAWF